MAEELAHLPPARDGLERYELQLQRLLALVGTVDPASTGFQAVLAECARCAEGFEREVQRLAQAPPLERARAREQVQALLRLNGLAQDALRRECNHVGLLIAQTRTVRECLAQAVQPVETGDSCDVRG